MSTWKSIECPPEDGHAVLVRDPHNWPQTAYIWENTWYNMKDEKLSFVPWRWAEIPKEIPK